jgi:hypothetical protein
MTAITVPQFKQGQNPGKPIYRSLPYVLLSVTGLVLSADTLVKLHETVEGHYYDNCTVDVRTHDLYLNDNVKIEDEPVAPVVHFRSTDLVEIKARFTGEGLGWEARPVLATIDAGALYALDSQNWSTVVKVAKAFGRMIGAVEVRWNWKGGLQGHYESC